MSRNLLDAETSPYLLLHKDNPVHWRPWGKEALAEAEAAGKPILLSVGYTACHWCHVMNEESFADPETAALINDLYIPIKVDREERPDVDQIYQHAANVLGNGGGWPLTMFLTPLAEPFFAATYIPKEERYGAPAFKNVLIDVSRMYKDQPEGVSQASTRVQDVYASLWASDQRGTITPATPDNLAVHIGQRFDMFFGGLTGAPKFPTIGLVEVLWRAYLRTGINQFNVLVHTTLDGMCLGGIYDHIGGGLARYATDERWFVPHFEKMLSDNAQLIHILTLVWQHTRNGIYRERIEDTIKWVFREMMVGDAFATSLDADSEGEEGKYYLWTEAEIDAALKGTFSQRFKEVYGIVPQGNHTNGRNIIHQLMPARNLTLTPADGQLLKKQRELLLAARQKRVAPQRDDKVLADWNGLMIAALAQAGAVFRNPEWINAAVRAYDFVVKALGDGDRLHHSWRDGKRGAIGFSDDYAQMARAALILFEIDGDKRFLTDAQRWVHHLNEHHWDNQSGGYYYTSDEADPLIARPRSPFDTAMPCANGQMVEILARLYFITGEENYRRQSNAQVEAFSGRLDRAAPSMGTFINGLEFILAGLQIIIVGPPDNAKTHELVMAVMGRSLPVKVLQIKAPGETLPEGHPAYGKEMINGQPTAYLCQNATCSPPITNPVQLSQVLQLPRQAQPQQMPAPQGSA